MENNCCVIQFAKLPESGKVKTRMQPQLTSEQCRQLHEWLTCKVFESLCLSSQGWSYQLSVSAQPDAVFFQNLVADAGQNVPVLKQSGIDLGERMASAFRLALETFEFVVIVGSDCPFLKPVHLQQLFQRMSQGSECVLIPAEDGGYVAIGCSRYLPELFRSVAWGTSNVFGQTIRKLQQAAISYQCLAPMADIDRPEDLLLLSNWDSFLQLQQN